jgi:hypothetical protein
MRLRLSMLGMLLLVEGAGVVGVVVVLLDIDVLKVVMFIPQL